MKARTPGTSTRVTLTDIAQLAGVSVTTVSRVLGGRAGEVKISEKTTNRILDIAREQNYRPNLFAKALRTNKSHLIGLVVWDFGDPYYGAIVVGAQTELARHGYTAVLTDAGRSEEELAASLHRMGAFQTDGALVIGGPADFEHSALAGIRDDPRRIVYIGTHNPHPGAASVIVDNYEGGRSGVDYLISHWQRPLVWLRPEQLNYDTSQRVLGIEAAVAEQGYESRSLNRVTRLGEDGGYKTCSELLRELEPPFSLFAQTDLTAIGAVHAAYDAGLRVPEDIAILGFDDLSLAAHINPPLSTVRQPRQRLGIRAAEILVENLDKPSVEDPEPARLETVPTELVVRATA